MSARVLLLIVASWILVGCVHRPPPSLEQLDLQMAENTKSASRTYKDKTPAEVRSASHKVLYLLDPPDMQFDVRNNELLATRSGMLLVAWVLLNNRDWYSVNLNQSKEGTVATLGLVNESNHNILVGGFIPLSFKSNIPVSATNNPADFKLFHDRVEYVLGINPVWTTCEQAKKWSPDKLMMLCDSIGLENLSPNDLAKQTNLRD